MLLGSTFKPSYNELSFKEVLAYCFNNNHSLSNNFFGVEDNISLCTIAGTSLGIISASICSSVLAFLKKNQIL